MKQDDVFGCLALIEPAGGGWRCLCDCGRIRFVNEAELARVSADCECQQDAPRGGRTRWRSGGSSRKTRHEPTYKVWKGMIARCHRPSSGAFYKYGARGVRVCVRWRLSYAAFETDMGRRPVDMTIDRIDSSRGYAPDNCRWATPRQQRENSSSGVHRLTWAGRTLTIREWSERTGLRVPVIKSRVQKGWPAWKVLTWPQRPLRPRKKRRIPCKKVEPMTS